MTGTIYFGMLMESARSINICYGVDVPVVYNRIAWEIQDK